MSVRNSRLPNMNRNQGAVGVFRVCRTVSADCNVTHRVRVKVDHLGEEGGFGTAHADSGASSGSEGIEASGQEHQGDCARDGAIACDGAAVFAGPGSGQALWASRSAGNQAGWIYTVSASAH